jgi:predicted esterase
VGRRAILAVAVWLLAPAVAAAGEGKAPAGKALDELARRYLAADERGREEVREGLDRDLAPLSPAEVGPLREALLRIAQKTGPRLERSGDHWFHEEKGSRRGRYIASLSPGKPLFLGLHGGGEGSGDAGSATGMSLSGCSWIYPEVLEKTEHGWTDAGTEEFVMELVEAAKRTVKVDPDRVYVAGHSMGGYGAWTLGAHHADVFAGAGAFAGAPSPIWRSDAVREVIGIVEGVLPNCFHLRLHVYQSTDDPQVPPQPNQFATKALAEWRERYPDGFDFRYVEVEGHGHAAPPGGYGDPLEWVAERRRDPRPKHLLWQPSLPWKRQWFWLRWRAPEAGAILEARAVEGNAIEITTVEGSGDVTGLSVLLGPPLVDLEKEVVIRVDGKEAFRGLVPRTLSTLLLTFPRNDPGLLFDARVDL